MATDARRGEISRETPQTDLCETSGVDWTRDAVVRDLEASTSTDTNAAGRNRALVAVPAPGERAESDARVVAAAGFCQCVGGETQVMQIATRPSLRRRGLGTRMLKAMLGLVPDNTGVLEARASNDGALAMYEKCGYHYLDKREPVYAQFTASLNLHDGAMHGRKHYLMCKNVRQATWLDGDNYFLFSESREGVLWGC